MTNSPNPNPGLITPHGGYRELKSYQMSEIVYDATVKFCNRFIDSKSRTHDQMVQAARRGNKNIAEGSEVSGTSKKSAANTMLCVINQTNYLLDQQLRQLEQAFLEGGGFTERLYQTRTEIRRRQNRSYKPNQSYEPHP